MKTNAQHPTSIAKTNTLQHSTGTNGAASMLTISSIIVVAMCTDGKCRLVRLKDNEPRQLFRYLDGMCDHQVHLIMTPVRVVIDQPLRKKNFFQRAKDLFSK